MPNRPSENALEIIKTLVSFDTTSRDSNLALIDWVRSYLEKLGIVSHLVFDSSGKKANLWATIGPADRPGLVLSGHTDVVPIDGQEWHVEAFDPIEKDGKLYGRGTTDMKSFVGVCLALAPEISKMKLAAPIHFAFSYDEEVGCLGVRGLLADLADRGIKPMGCVVGEPTSMKVIRAHKGKLSLRAHVRGFECHSSLAPRGVNAVQFAARAIGRLVEMGEGFAENGPYDHEFDIPYTTVHVGIVHGGTALNIVPKDCSFDFEFRHLPVHDPRKLFAEFEHYVRANLEPAMKSVNSDTGFTFEELSNFPGLTGDEDSEVTQAAKAASGGNATGKVAFGTEAGLFEASGIPTVICGPGDIDQAHKPDEFVALEQIAMCEQFVKRLVRRFEISR
ncbi:MAG: acetylornithine deacetylase [Alphaproteobacteria bacterium]|nr:acetylornithine deacetylase [Alphaproteobacteria bacterium]